jgi:hypothetical protein
MRSGVTPRSGPGEPCFPGVRVREWGARRARESRRRENGDSLDCRVFADFCGGGVRGRAGLRQQRQPELRLDLQQRWLVGRVLGKRIRVIVGGIERRVIGFELRCSGHEHELRWWEQLRVHRGIELGLQFWIQLRIGLQLRLRG